MTSINKGERAELKFIVRQQFKVLRNELEQRELEMLAEVETQIVQKFAGDDQTWAALQHAVHEAVMAANRQINDALREHGYTEHGPSERMWVGTPPMRQPQEKRTELRVHAHAKIKAQVRGGRLELDRREADLLRTLAVGALESDDAQAFLASIPSVGELVPAARLAELEASLQDGAAS